MMTLLTCILAIYGLLIGSAINAIVWRLYAGKSWTKGRSMCPDCKHVLTVKDLVPVFSWLALRGNCRYCSKKIHWQYPVVELGTAALFTLSYLVILPLGLLAWVYFVFWLVILAMMIILAVCDLRWLILPNKIMFPLLIIGLVRLLLVAVTGNSLMAWLGPLEAALAVGGAFFIMANLKNGTLMGGGDVKLAAFMGLLLGLQKTALAMILAFNSAAIIAMILIGFKIRKRKDMIPFGPFLIAGTIVAYLYGGDIIHWYLVLNGLNN